MGGSRAFAGGGYREVSAAVPLPSAIDGHHRPLGPDAHSGHETSNAPPNRMRYRAHARRVRARRQREGQATGDGRQAASGKRQGYGGPGPTLCGNPDVSGSRVGVRSRWSRQAIEAGVGASPRSRPSPSPRSRSKHRVGPGPPCAGCRPRFRRGGGRNVEPPAQLSRSTLSARRFLRERAGSATRAAAASALAPQAAHWPARRS